MHRHTPSLISHSAGIDFQFAVRPAPGSHLPGRPGCSAARGTPARLSSAGCPPVGARGNSASGSGSRSGDTRPAAAAPSTDRSLSKNNPPAPSDRWLYSSPRAGAKGSVSDSTVTGCRHGPGSTRSTYADVRPCQQGSVTWAREYPPPMLAYRLCADHAPACIPTATAYLDTIQSV